ncbi:Ig-like domain-containing protein [uncultured Clostridium sp.]|uniref:Ig-like domain-containing protein n=1 Tax=uncultured Clostridium sp. TaxID=59620 RepID=UPI0025F73074|nr:Ig-like domain-containing protein [uncultured Clostridium sp.]
MKRDFVKKLICYAAITGTLASLPTASYAATWLSDNAGNYYFYENNNYAVGWRNIDGTVYYFNGSGIMQKGWIQYGDSWYYLDENGALKTGWINYNGDWYYSDSAGIMQIGTIQINGKVYSFSNNGVMRKGSIIINGQFYTLGSDGAVVGNSDIVPDKIFDQFNNCIQQNKSTDTSAIIKPDGSKFDNVIEDQSEIGDYEEPKQKFTVTFRDENGQQLKDKKVTDGDTVKTYEPDDETDQDRNFIEWNTKRDGSGKSYDDDEKIKITKDLTLYAIWSEAEEKTEVTGITISGDSEVEIGKTIQLTADVTPSNATNTKVKWSIESATGDNVGSATIDSDGVLRGVAKGKVIVKAEAADGSKMSATKEFNVVDAKTLVTGITIKADSDKITTDGGTLKITADVTPKEASTSSVKWKVIEGSSYASISEDGTLKAIADGTVKVQASAKDGSGINSNVLTIQISNQTVKVKKLTVSAEGNKKKISVGEPIVITAKAYPDDAQNTDVTWTAKYTTGPKTGEPADIVSESGNTMTLKPNAKGKIEITATSKIDSSIVGKTTLTAVKDAEAIYITGDSHEIKQNTGKLALSALFVKPNTTTVDAEVDTTSVKWSIEDITDDENKAPVTTGSAVTITTSCDKARINPSTKTAVVTGLKNGKVRVYAIAEDNKKVVGYYDIAISNQYVKATKLDLNVQTTGSTVTTASQVDIKKGDEITLIAEIGMKKDENGQESTEVPTATNVKWSVYGDTSVISYSEDPSNKNKLIIKANKKLSKETSTITVKVTVDDLSQQCIINVNDVIDDITFSNDAVNNKVLINEPINITARLFPTYMSGDNVEWSNVSGSAGKLSPDGNPKVNGNVSTQKFVSTTVGDVVIKAEADGYSKKTNKIKVLDEITSVEARLKDSSSASGASVTLGSESGKNTKTVELKAVVNGNENNQDYNDFILWKAEPVNTSLVKVSVNSGIVTITRDIGSEDIPSDAFVLVTPYYKSSNGNITEKSKEFKINLINEPTPPEQTGTGSTQTTGNN